MDNEQLEEYEAKTEVTKEQVMQFLKQEQQQELKEDKALVEELTKLATSRGRQIIAVIQTHQNGLIANAVWGVQKIN